MLIISLIEFYTHSKNNQNNFIVISIKNSDKPSFHFPYVSVNDMKKGVPKLSAWLTKLPRVLICR